MNSAALVILLAGWVLSKPQPQQWNKQWAPKEQRWDPLSRQEWNSQPGEPIDDQKQNPLYTQQQQQQQQWPQGQQWQPQQKPEWHQEQQLWPLQQQWNPALQQQQQWIPPQQQYLPQDQQQWLQQDQNQQYFPQQTAGNHHHHQSGWPNVQGTPVDEDGNPLATWFDMDGNPVVMGVDAQGNPVLLESQNYPQWQPQQPNWSPGSPCPHESPVYNMPNNLPGEDLAIYNLNQGLSPYPFYNNPNDPFYNSPCQHQCDHTCEQTYNPCWVPIDICDCPFHCPPLPTGRPPYKTTTKKSPHPGTSPSSAPPQPPATSTTSPPPPPETTTSLSPARNCSVPGWNTIDGHEYYLSQQFNRLLPWWEADAKALQLGASLAEVDDEEEVNRIQKIAQCYPGNPQMWLGGNDLAVPGTWFWSRGQPVNLNNWAGGWPGEGDCMAVSFQGGHNKWVATQCEGYWQVQAFVAERLPEKTTVKVQPRPPTRPTVGSTTTTFPLTTSSTTTPPPPTTTTTTTPPPPTITTTQSPPTTTTTTVTPMASTTTTEEDLATTFGGDPATAGRRLF